MTGRGSKPRRPDKEVVAPRFMPTVAFQEHPIILKDEDLQWTERFKSGVFCFHNGQLGISFKCAHRGLLAEIDYKYVFGAPKEALAHSKKMKCLFPILPGTFQPVEAPAPQVEVMRQLLGVASAVESLLKLESSAATDEECSQVRLDLNRLYDKFIKQYGLIRNCSTYFDGVWSDVRLQVYLLELEGDKGEKADIFKHRINHPPQEVVGQLFEDEDLNVRIQKAFAWCLGWHGTVLVSEVAQKAGVDEAFAIKSLLEQGLVYREWLGLQHQEWYEVLGVEPDCSASQLKSAYRSLAKQYHPDVNREGAAELMMKQINDAYEEGMRTREKVCV